VSKNKLFIFKHAFIYFAKVCRGKHANHSGTLQKLLTGQVCTVLSVQRNILLQPFIEQRRYFRTF
jgi:hypothetical protein